jgi:hypothetical protein
METEKVKFSNSNKNSGGGNHKGGISKIQMESSWGILCDWVEY